MLLFAKKYKSIHEIFETYMHTSDVYEDIDFIFDVVHYFRRRSRNKKVAISIEELISELEHSPDRIAFFREKLYNVFANKQKVILFTDAGLLNSVSFFKELRRRISRQIIPDQPSQENIQYVLNQLFYKPSDAKWMLAIPIENWKSLFRILEVTTFYEDAESKTSQQILLAIMILSQRMGGLALQTDVRRMVPEYAHLNSPFIALDDELNNLGRTLAKENRPYLYIQEHELDYKQLNILIGQCEDFVNKADANSSKYGVTFSVNQMLLLIRQQVKRIKRLYNYLFIEKEEDKTEKAIDFYLDMVKTNSKKNNVRKLIDDSVYNITYEITNYTGKTGEHYITSTGREYFKMLKTALWGGVIVSFMCLVKLYLSMQKDHSDFLHALNYSLNYAIGFVLIYLTGSTLATKQPAMTASTIAKTLENLSENNDKVKTKQYTEFSELFTRLFRSQFIAFVGNVFGAFPISMLLVIGMSYLEGYNIATKKSLLLLKDLNIWHTPVFFHACIAGIFLFLSGIIAGNVASVNNFNNFYYRLSEHPILKGFLGKNRMLRIAKWMQKKWPSVVSNIWFGIFMGSAWAVGKFFGLPIDIRHITFASGNFAYGLYGANFMISIENIVWCILGIGIIGFGNFIVSFLLSLWIALRSREVPMSELKQLARCVWSAFKTQPRAFFLPVRRKI